MKNLVLSACLLLLPSLFFGQDTAAAPRLRLYLMPGFGSDERVFSQLRIQNADTVSLHFLLPEEDETIAAYARRMAAQLDTTRPFALLGVSFGGMVAVEMGKFLRPEKIFLVASAKCREELPVRYRFQKYVPLYKAVGGRFMKKSGPFAARFFEPAMRPELPFFREMLRAKDDDFMERTVGCIARWDNATVPPNLIHIHGSKDHTLPLRRIGEAIVLPGAGHWAVYYNALEISEIVDAALQK